MHSTVNNQFLELASKPQAKDKPSKKLHPAYALVPIALLAIVAGSLFLLHEGVRIPRNAHMGDINLKVRLMDVSSGKPEKFDPATFPEVTIILRSAHGTYAGGFHATSDKVYQLNAYVDPGKGYEFVALYRLPSKKIKISVINAPKKLSEGGSYSFLFSEETLLSVSRQGGDRVDHFRV